MSCIKIEQFFSDILNMSSDNSDMSSDHEEGFSCPKCEKTFSHRPSLTRHISSVHVSDLQKKFACSKCDAMFASPQGIGIHMSKVHAPEEEAYDNSKKKIACLNCEKLFASPRGIAVHMSKVHAPEEEAYDNSKKKFACQNCEKLFASPRGIKVHVSKVHAPEEEAYDNSKKKFACQNCEKLFFCSQNLRRHISEVHETESKEKEFDAPDEPSHQKKSDHIAKAEEIDCYSKKFTCPFCENLFSSSRNLRRHICRIHTTESKEEESDCPDEPSHKKRAIHVAEVEQIDDCVNKFSCPKYEKMFTHSQNVTHHISRVHAAEKKTNNDGDQSVRPSVHTAAKNEVKKRDIIACCQCNYTCERNSIEYHYAEAHGVKLKNEYLQFENVDEFNSWKQNKEKSTNSKFVLTRTHVRNKCKTFHYGCHRSGFYKSKSKGLRQLKIQGSNKINNICPAKLQLKQEEDGSCSVKFQGTHFGHQNSLDHLTLSQSERQEIVTNIATGLSFNAILDKIRNSVSDDERIHRIKKKDLYNIKASFNFESLDMKNINIRQEEDNVDAKLEALEKESYKWVLQSENSTELHVIEENHSKCNHCQLRYTEGETCMHKYTCSCTDSSARWDMCEHINLVCQYIKQQEDANSMLDTEAGSAYSYIDDTNCQEVVVSQLTTEADSASFINEKQKLEGMFNDIIITLESKEELEECEKALLSLRSALARKRESEMQSFVPQDSITEQHKHTYAKIVGP